MQKIKECVEKRIGLKVTVNNKPAKAEEDGIRHVRVDKWWISILTSPENPAMPRQKIKLEIANISAHTRELVPLKANYDVLGGMPMVMINAESLDEIMADKVLACPTSLLDNTGWRAGPHLARIRHRDMWDLAWMASRGAKLDPRLVIAKIKDYGLMNYSGLLAFAIEQIPQTVKNPEFKAQMTRFIDSSTIARTLDAVGYDDYLASSAGGLFGQMQTALNAMPVAIAAQAVIPAAQPKARRRGRTEGQAQAGSRARAMRSPFARPPRPNARHSRPGV